MTHSEEKKELLDYILAIYNFTKDKALLDLHNELKNTTYWIKLNTQYPLLIEKIRGNLKEYIKSKIENPRLSEMATDTSKAIFSCWVSFELDNIISFLDIASPFLTKDLNEFRTSISSPKNQDEDALISLWNDNIPNLMSMLIASLNANLQPSTGVPTDYSEFSFNALTLAWVHWEKKQLIEFFIGVVKTFKDSKKIKSDIEQTTLQSLENFEYSLNMPIWREKTNAWLVSLRDIIVNKLNEYRLSHAQITGLLASFKLLDSDENPIKINFNQLRNDWNSMTTYIEHYRNNYYKTILPGESEAVQPAPNPREKRKRSKSRPTKVVTWSDLTDDVTAKKLTPKETLNRTLILHKILIELLTNIKKNITIETKPTETTSTAIQVWDNQAAKLSPSSGTQTTESYQNILFDYFDIDLVNNTMSAITELLKRLDIYSPQYTRDERVEAQSLHQIISIAHNFYQLLQVNFQTLQKITPNIDIKNQSTTQSKRTIPDFKSIEQMAVSNSCQNDPLISKILSEYQAECSKLEHLMSKHHSYKLFDEDSEDATTFLHKIDDEYTKELETHRIYLEQILKLDTLKNQFDDRFNMLSTKNLSITDVLAKSRELSTTTEKKLIDWIQDFNRSNLITLPELFKKILNTYMDRIESSIFITLEQINKPACKKINNKFSSLKTDEDISKFVQNLLPKINRSEIPKLSFKQGTAASHYKNLRALECLLMNFKLNANDLSTISKIHLTIPAIFTELNGIVITAKSLSTLTSLFSNESSSQELYLARELLTTIAKLDIEAKLMPINQRFNDLISPSNESDINFEDIASKLKSLKIELLTFHGEISNTLKTTDTVITNLTILYEKSAHSHLESIEALSKIFVQFQSHYTLYFESQNIFTQAIIDNINASILDINEIAFVYREDIYNKAISIERIKLKDADFEREYMRIHTHIFNIIVKLMNANSNYIKICIDRQSLSRNQKLLENISPHNPFLDILKTKLNDVRIKDKEFLGETQRIEANADSIINIKHPKFINPAQLDIVLGNFNHNTQIISNIMTKALKITQKALIVEKRLKNPLYISTIEVLQGIKDEQQRIKQIQLAIPDPRLPKLSALYDEFLGLNQQYINEDITKLDDKTYREAIRALLIKIHNDNMEAFSDEIRPEFVQFTRRKIIKPLQWFFRELVNIVTDDILNCGKTYNTGVCRATFFATQSEKEMIHLGNRLAETYRTTINSIPSSAA